MIPQIFADYTLNIVFWGALTIGISSGALGTFAILRQQSLLGDAIAHATLPGIGLAFLITGNKEPLTLLIGAALAGWIGTLFIKLITDYTTIKKDTALGIVLSVFFGFGLVILTLIQRLPTATKAGLDKFLFGNAASLLRSDVETMMSLSLLIFIILLLFWKEFKVIVFDADFAKSQGVMVHFFDLLLTSLIVAAIVIGLQTVGVVLMSAMLVAPAAAARQWTNNLSIMVILSCMFGASAGIMGAVTSSQLNHLPTGPTIVIFLSIFVFMSLLFAPNRGLLWDWQRAMRTRKKIMTTTMLQNMMLFSESHTNPFHPHDIAALKAIGRGALNKTMQELQRKGWAKQLTDKRWALTPEGFNMAKEMTREVEAQINVSSSN